jgi:hypothetical protein
MLELRRPVWSMVVPFEFGTTLRSLPLVILIRWIEHPEDAESAVCNSSVEALRLISTSLGSLRMGLPGQKISYVLWAPQWLRRAFGHQQGAMLAYPLAQR